jgi:hypothetical protein
MYDIIY